MVEFNHKIALINIRKEGAKSSHFTSVWVSVHINTEKAMAPHSSTLAWKIPWTGESGRLQSMGSLRVTHDWATSLSLFPFMHWRRRWQPTPVFLLGGFHGQRSLVGYSPRGHKEPNTTQRLHFHFLSICFCPPSYLLLAGLPLHTLSITLFAWMDILIQVIGLNLACFTMILTS